MTKKIIEIINSQGLYKNVFVFITLWIVASAAFHGHYSKWWVKDFGDKCGMEQMLEGKAYKPYVYRQLLPTIANQLAKVASNDLKDEAVTIAHDKLQIKILDGKSPDYCFRYLVVYGLTFLSLFGALLVLNKLILFYNDNNQKVALITTIFFGLAMPYIQTNGGFFYDFSELFFLFTAIWFATKDNKVGLLLTVLIATLNKESFFLFLPSLIPLIRRNNDQFKSIATVLAGVLISVAVGALIKSMYLDNPGGSLEFHFRENGHNYIRYFTYFKFDITYGLFSPAGFNLINVIIMSILIGTSFGKLDIHIQRHMIINLLVTLPLFVLFCATNELRNFSFLYFGLCLLLSKNIQRL